MKHFILTLVALVTACSSTGEVDYDKTARAVFAAGGAMRTLAADPSFEPEFQQKLLDAADALNAAGHAVEAVAIFGSGDADVADKIAVAIAVLQQTFQGIDPDRYEEYRPYFITAQVLLSVIQSQLEETVVPQ